MPIPIIGDGQHVDPKSSPLPGWRSVEVVEKPHLGFQYEKEGEICGDKRCDYCGKWFTWTNKSREKYMRDFNWKIEHGSPIRRKVGNKLYLIPNTINEEPIHCGTTHCKDYHERVVKHETRMVNDPVYRKRMQKELEGKRFFKKNDGKRANKKT